MTIWHNESDGWVVGQTARRHHRVELVSIQRKDERRYSVTASERPIDMKNQWSVQVFVLVVSSLISATMSHAAEPINIGSRRELFVDRYLIDTLNGARLVLHRPRREGPAVQFNERPWEGRYSGYCTVIRDGIDWRLYHRGRPEHGKDGDIGEVTCVSQSSDGVTWTRPKLGLFEVAGTKENNVVLAGMPPYSHNFSPWIDRKPGVVTDECYKSLSGVNPEGLALFVSADGFDWKLKKKAVLTSKEFAFDSQACAFWSETEQCYVCYFRSWKDSLRWISRSTSDDCLQWSELVKMDYGDTPAEHLYTNNTTPYYRAPHIYVALAQRFFTKSALPSEDVAKLIPDKVHHGYCSDVALLTTRGGNHYDRTFLESFIRPGPSARDWVSRNNTPAWGIVPASDNQRRMYLYRQAHVSQPTAHVVRYSLRVDGFASVSAPFSGGELLTKPLTFSGKRLELNYETSAAGSLRVEIQDAAGEPMSGFALADATELFGDEINRTYAWKSGTDVSTLAGKTIRLRFVMKDADLYSFRLIEPLHRKEKKQP